MSRPRKPFRKTVTVADVNVTVYERKNSTPLWIDVTVGGKRRRISAGHSNRELALQEAQELAQDLAERSEAEWGPDLTLGCVVDVYMREKGPLLSPRWRQQIETQAHLFLEAWGHDLPVVAIDQTLADNYVDSRRSGRLTPTKGRTRGVRDGTIHAEFRSLKVVFNWAKRRRRPNGRPLLTGNPLDGLTWPKERNVRRPVASHDRFLQTLAMANTVDGSGRLRCALTLGRYTGRREGAICGLSASDLLMDEVAVRAALAAQGMDERKAEHFPFGGIRWRSDTDKMGTAWIVPISEQAPEEIDGYLQTSPRLGAVPLFPSDRDPMKPIGIYVMGRWLMEAERLAGLPKLEQGRWHPYRRLWATERKHVPVQDVAAAGGWNSVDTVLKVYQQSDPQGVLRAVTGSA